MKSSTRDEVEGKFHQIFCYPYFSDYSVANKREAPKTTLSSRAPDNRSALGSSDWVNRRARFDFPKKPVGLCLPDLRSKRAIGCWDGRSP